MGVGKGEMEAATAAVASVAAAVGVVVGATIAAVTGAASVVNVGSEANAEAATVVAKHAVRTPRATKCAVNPATSRRATMVAARRAQSAAKRPSRSLSNPLSTRSRRVNPARAAMHAKAAAVAAVAVAATAASVVKVAPTRRRSMAMTSPCRARKASTPASQLKAHPLR